MKDSNQLEETSTSSRKEQVLLEEMNRIAERGHKHFQWSLSLLVTLETALFFVRKEAADRAGFSPGEPFPFERHLWGTVLISSLTAILIVIARAIYGLYEHYQSQLPAVLSSGVASPRKRRLKALVWVALIMFPLFDLFIGASNSMAPLHHDPRFTRRDIRESRNTSPCC